jgi:hypothetical protein
MKFVKNNKKLGDSNTESAEEAQRTRFEGERGTLGDHGAAWRGQGELVFGT